MKLEDVLYVSEYDINFSDDILGSQTDGYNVKCYDGHAVGENGVVQIVLSYPRLCEMTPVKIEECLAYRYGTEYKEYDAHFGDVMMLMGRIKSIKLL